MLRKVDEKKLVEYRSHLCILVLNEMWVEWVSGMWDPIIIYDKSESWLLFADGGSIYKWNLYSINFFLSTFLNILLKSVPSRNKTYNSGQRK